MTSANSQIKDNTTSAADFSPAIQDYLKACYRISRNHDGSASTSQLATELAVAAPSVTNMVKRLGRLRLVKRVREGRIALTAEGQSIALEVVRHHRLLETFLVEELGMDWADAHQEAEVLEHYISERLEALLDKRLATPKHDPHGEPIPTKSGKIPHASYISLINIESGDKVIIRQVRSQNPELLTYLQQSKLTPGTTITLKQIAPFGGSLEINIAKQTIHVGREAAECIYCERIR